MSRTHSARDSMRRELPLARAGKFPDRTGNFIDASPVTIPKLSAAYLFLAEIVSSFVRFLAPNLPDESGNNVRVAPQLSAQTEKFGAKSPTDSPLTRKFYTLSPRRDFRFARRLPSPVPFAEAISNKKGNLWSASPLTRTVNSVAGKRPSHASRCSFDRRRASATDKLPGTESESSSSCAR